ncbi:cell division protein ZapB [Candidatus Thiothrix anitrata]|jgi:cell division protein ZapB|uniref:Cell division protein ZapB n=1 Tax=Candidatus Thiothrix anitrata TaxID=2823902 RepID=A0ABX7X8V1_9GAMM|nr:cell division protein ZapB [Candidatus Thiothrix anitrata]QTR51649.1 cell division protein ZapB [Candidatus Thiothrix anitrata]
MNAQTPDISVKEQLTSIEGRVQRLLDLVDKLSSENSELKKREKVLVQECNELQQRNDKAGSQLEAMIDRLKNQAHG